MSTDINELNENSTHEYVQQLVDNIVEERKEQYEEETSDSQQIAEERDEAHVPTAEEGDDSGPEPQAWLDDDLKAEAAAYGIDEDELSEFTSREELDRVFHVLDKKLAPERDEKGRFKKDDSTEEEEPSDGRYEIGLDKDLYDDDLVGEFEKMRDHYESRLETLESRFREVDRQAEEERFDRLVDSLDMPELFGSTGKESQEELDRRQAIFIRAKAEKEVLAKMGRQADFNEAFLMRVARSEFPDEIDKKNLKARTRKVFGQHNQRMGGSQTRPTPPAQSLKEEMRQLYRELDDAG